MKIAALVFLSCALWEVNGYPYYPYYGNMDSLSYGSSDNSRGGMVYSRYYSPYSPRVGMAAFMYRQPQEQAQPSQYYLPDRRRQTPQEVNYNIPPQENEVFYQQPEKPVVTELTELAEPTERSEISTTVKAIVPEIVEPEVEELEPEQKPRKRVSKKRPDYKPVGHGHEEEDDQPQVPAGAFFPMFFGWGGKSGGGNPGAVAIANAYSTGRGGVATSHATSYGAPRPDDKMYQE